MVASASRVVTGNDILGGVAVLSGGLMAWQWAAGLRFPLNARMPVAAPFPSVSILKPVKGADPGTARALATWLRQDYRGVWEVVFGVDSEGDPGLPLLRELVSQAGPGRARIVVCGESLGINRKVSNLIQMGRTVSSEVLLVSDADVMAPADLLGQMVQRLQRPGVGLVHCLYRLADPSTPATAWEAFTVNADFWSQVLQDRSLGPLKYALGASMALRREHLAAVGGFEAFADHLADDHQLGRRISGLGKRTELCPVVVDCHVAPAGWVAAWRHQLRWAVTIRVCQPLAHFMSVLANGTVWPMVFFLGSGSVRAGLLAGSLVLFRVVQGLMLEARMTGQPVRWGRWWLPLLKDGLQALLWGVALVKRQVVWRGHRFIVRRRCGRLVPVS